jgi:IS4 transposase
MDRAFVDWERLYNINENKAYFVTRSKVNMKFKRISSSKVNKSSGVLCDQTIKLVNYYAEKEYPDKFRRIKYVDEETQKQFVFITNNFDLEPMQIAHLYKYRWKIELFFKWIKQHLKVKSFWGYSENAVKVQVYCALITFLTVVIVKQKLKLIQSHYEILQILSITLLNKTPLNQLFQDALLHDFKEKNANQLKMF